MAKAQRPDELLQEYIYQFSELVKMVRGLKLIQVTDPFKIIIFNKHLFNWEIKKSVAKGYHWNLKEAFNSALAAERKAKKFKGLTDDDLSVMAITARRQVKQVMATYDNEQMPDLTDLNQTAVDGTQPTNATFSRQKFHTNCYKCGERGHYARECPQSLAATQIVLPPAQPPITLVPATQMDTPTMHMIPTVGPPKVVQTITSEGQLPMGAWNVMLEQLGQTQAEKKQMKKFVKKYVPFNKRNDQDQKQSTKQQSMHHIPKQMMVRVQRSTNRSP